MVAINLQTQPLWTQFGEDLYDQYYKVVSNKSVDSLFEILDLARSEWLSWGWTQSYYCQFHHHSYCFFTVYYILTYNQSIKGTRTWDFQPHKNNPPFCVLIPNLANWNRFALWLINHSAHIIKINNIAFCLCFGIWYSTKVGQIRERFNKVLKQTYRLWMDSNNGFGWSQLRYLFKANKINNSRGKIGKRA